MEKVVDNSAGSMSVSDKKSSSSNLDDVVGHNPTSTTTPLGAAPPKMADTLRKTVGGPTKRRSGGADEVAPGSANMKRVRDGQSCGGVLAAAAAADDDEKPTPNLQPFDVFVPAGASYISAGGLGFPFTHAQWQELARQAMIYKYMISSVPVPHNLLRTALDSSAASSVKYGRNGSDLEPGRCKRTDGKKWRCSRDVAPQQKYCERHLHRGRPRSRKRVEAKFSSNVDETHKKTSLQQSSKLPKSPGNSSQPQVFASNLLFNAATDLTHRNLGLTMMGTEATMEEAKVEYGNMGLPMYGSTMVYNQDFYYMEQHQQQQHHPMDLLSNSKFPISEIKPSIGFWPPIDHGLDRSINVNQEPSLSPPNHENLLSLSLGDALDYEQMGRIQAGNDSNSHYDGLLARTEDSRFFFGPNSWQPFASGGPLAEALHPNSGSNPTSPPYDSSHVATTVSSPSGVLQRSLFSHSDNSACNSPTLGGAPQPPESVFRWLN